MRYVRYKDKNETISYGVLEGETIKKIDGDLFGTHKITDVSLLLKEVKLLAPCLPSKVVCIGINYITPILEVNLVVPKKPAIFLKPETSVIGVNEGIKYPDGFENVDISGELGIVISKICTGVPREKSMNYVLGYTCLNNVSAKNAQAGDDQWVRGRIQDTFCPIGPIITDEIDCFHAEIETRLNGELKQKRNTKDLLFDIPTLIAAVAEGITLKPGDIITTGTPYGVAPVKVGDVAEVEISGIGVLKNPVIKK
jgi:2-keto-4-pentenoate hydratase/2-oxohepta-3-ene-1,7-dioic acid hydratase in catechol pathway